VTENEPGVLAVSAGITDRRPRGIDMTIKDYRWNTTAQGRALYAAKGEKMAQWLEDAERQLERGRNPR
jgi:hypothetical protein